LQLCRRTDHVETWSPPYVFNIVAVDSGNVQVRECTTADERRRSLDIYNAVWPHRAVTQEAVEAWKRMAISSIEYLGSLDGEDVGSAAASFETARTNLVSMLVTVLPRHRRAGVGTALVEAVTAWATEIGARDFETRVEADDADSLGFALRRGFHEHSKEDGLALDLRNLEPPPVDPPGGVEIVTLAEHPELERGVYDVAAEALPDVPGSEDWVAPPFEQFAAAQSHALVIFVALAEREVIGYAKLVGLPDGRTADHGITAVKREWRNRGVAKALKVEQIAWAKANGLERLTTSNEERNAPMRRINEVLGYRPAPGRVRLRRAATTG
jgi:GNAT superfamily N-acetyltransferase